MPSVTRRAHVPTFVRGLARFAWSIVRVLYLVAVAACRATAPPRSTPAPEEQHPGDVLRKR
jgi:hypothetical protein